MKRTFLLLLTALMMAGCQPQKSMVATSPNFNKQTEQNSNAPKPTGNLENRNLAEANGQKIGAVVPKSNKSGQAFENECYGFDASGLKPDVDKQRRFLYQCEAAFNLDDDYGYFPILVVREYTYDQSNLDKKIYERFYLAEKFNLADVFRREVGQRKKANTTVKTSSISLGGAPAERIDTVFTCPDDQPARNSNNFESGKSPKKSISRCKPGSTIKEFSIIVDPQGILSDSEKNRNIPGFYLGGKLDKPEQEAALQRIIKSWRWK